MQKFSFDCRISSALPENPDLPYYLQYDKKPLGFSFLNVQYSESIKMRYWVRICDFTNEGFALGDNNFQKIFVYNLDKGEKGILCNENDILIGVSAQTPGLFHVTRGGSEIQPPIWLTTKENLQHEIMAHKDDKVLKQVLAQSDDMPERLAQLVEEAHTQDLLSKIKRLYAKKFGEADSKNIIITNKLIELLGKEFVKIDNTSLAKQIMGHAKSNSELKDGNRKDHLAQKLQEIKDKIPKKVINPICLSEVSEVLADLLTTNKDYLQVREGAPENLKPLYSYIFQEIQVLTGNLSVYNVTKDALTNYIKEQLLAGKTVKEIAKGAIGQFKQESPAPAVTSAGVILSAPALEGSSGGIEMKSM